MTSNKAAGISLCWCTGRPSLKVVILRYERDQGSLKGYPRPPLPPQHYVAACPSYTPREHGVKFVVDGIFCPVSSENLIVKFIRHPTCPFFLPIPFFYLRIHFG